jgi:hypothetical protein
MEISRSFSALPPVSGFFEVKRVPWMLYKQDRLRT